MAWRTASTRPRWIRRTGRPMCLLLLSTTWLHRLCVGSGIVACGTDTWHIGGSCGRLVVTAAGQQSCATILRRTILCFARFLPLPDRVRPMLQTGNTQHGGFVLVGGEIDRWSPAAVLVRLRRRRLRGSPLTASVVTGSSGRSRGTRMHQVACRRQFSPLSFERSGYAEYHNVQGTHEPVCGGSRRDVVPNTSGNRAMLLYG